MTVKSELRNRIAQLEEWVSRVPALQEEITKLKEMIAAQDAVMYFKGHPAELVAAVERLKTAKKAVEG